MKYLKHINELNAYNQEDLKEVIKDFLDYEKIKWDECDAIGVSDDEIDTDASCTWNS